MKKKNPMFNIDFQEKVKINGIKRSIVITTEDNDNIIDAEEYEVDITH